MKNKNKTCNLKSFGDVEMRCTICGYVTWKDDKLTSNEIIQDMIKSGYHPPKCHNKQ